MRKIKRCILWGMGKDYERILNSLFFEIYKENISVEAIVVRKEDKYCSKKDGFLVIDKEKIGDFDYMIITSFHFFEEIKMEAIRIGIPREKILNGRIFLLPFFDFQRYCMLLENPITILSDDCWGGYAYKYLYLPFSTPLINIYWDRDEYSKFISEPLFYLNTELTMVTKGDLNKGIFPVGQLGAFGHNVKMKFIHNVNFEEAKKQWNRRKERINYDNLFVKMGFDSYEENKEFYLNTFKKVPYNKILIYCGIEKIEKAFKTERFTWQETSRSYVDSFSYNDYFRKNFQYDLDLLKLLTGDKSYSRY